MVESVVFAEQLHFAPVEQQEQFFRQGLTFQTCFQFVVFTGKNAQHRIVHHESERRLAFEYTVVLYDAPGRTGDDMALEQKQAGDEQDRQGHPAGQAQTSLHIHRACKRQWPQGGSALFDAGEQERICTVSAVHPAQLQGVQQLVLYIREMPAYDQRRFFVRQDFADAEQMQKRPDEVPGDYPGCCSQTSKEEEHAHSCSEMADVFEQRGQDDGRSEQTQGEQSAAQQFVAVIPSDEGIEFSYQFVSRSLHCNKITKTVPSKDGLAYPLHIITL